AFEDAINIVGRVPELVDTVRPVGDQAAICGEYSVRVECRQPEPGRQLDDPIPTRAARCSARHDQAAIGGARECRDDALDLAGIPECDRAHLPPERGGRGLDSSELARPGRYTRTLKERHSLQTRRDLFEQPQPFCADAVFIEHKTSSVAARPG